MYQSHRVLGVWRGIGTQVITFSSFQVSEGHAGLGGAIRIYKRNGIRWYEWV